MHRARRTGLIVCAIALLAAACSSSGDGGGAGPSPVPTGIGNGHTGGKGGGKHHHKPGQHGKPGKGHHHKGGGSSSSPAPGQGSSHSSAPGPGHTSTTPSPHPSTKSGQPHPSTSSAPHPALPTVVVTPHSGLSSVQTVTVEGFHFKPNTLLVVAECQDRGLQTNQDDCNISNILTFAPGARVHSDANGHVAPVQITVRKTFKSVDCGAVKCLVAISQPTLQPHPENEGDQYIHFA